MAKQLNYQVNLSVNKNDLVGLLNSLKQIQIEGQQASLGGKLTNELKVAVETATQLEHILNSS